MIKLFESPVTGLVITLDPVAMIGA